jgi:hypothetical protein
MDQNWEAEDDGFDGLQLPPSQQWAEDRARGYLLGSIPEEEQTCIRSALIVDKDFYWFYQDAEAALISEYLRGDLPPQENADFERNYLPFHPERVELHRLLEAEEAHRKRPKVTEMPLRRSRWLYGLAAAAAIVAITIVGFFMQRQNQPANALLADQLLLLRKSMPLPPNLPPPPRPGETVRAPLQTPEAQRAGGNATRSDEIRIDGNRARTTELDLSWRGETRFIWSLPLSEAGLGFDYEVALRAPDGRTFQSVLPVLSGNVVLISLPQDWVAVTAFEITAKRTGTDTPLMKRVRARRVEGRR